MTNERTWMMIAVIALVTAGLRFLPFVIFNGRRQTPALVKKLGRLLPYAAMGMLVVYCLKNVSFALLSDWLPALIAGLLVVVLHLWKRNSLISIVCGTVCYMLLIQTVF